MLFQLDHKFFGLESIKELYATDFDFKHAYENCREGRTWNKFVLHGGLLYHANKLCVPASSVRLILSCGRSVYCILNLLTIDPCTPQRS
jgi:hypothetical protein